MDEKNQQWKWEPHVHAKLCKTEQWRHCTLLPAVRQNTRRVEKNHEKPNGSHLLVMVIVGAEVALVLVDALVLLIAELAVKLAQRLLQLGLELLLLLQASLHMSDRQTTIIKIEANKRKYCSIIVSRLEYLSGSNELGSLLEFNLERSPPLCS